MTDPAPAVEIRPAATLMLVRDGVDGMEVLMLRRHPDSVFAADAWVFPGGAVDPSDGELAPTTALGPTDGVASTTIGVRSGGLAFFVAAARECFEEAGVLLARHTGSGVALDTSSDLDASRLARLRRDLLTGRRSLAQILDAENLVLDLSRVFYVSHWITPPGPPRRFDTRFFVAAAPAGQAASHDTAETVESVWTTPALALERGAGGEIHLVFPTIKNLEVLGRFGSVGDLLVAASAIDSVPVVAPRFRGDPLIPPAALDGHLLTGYDPELPCPT
ncbi:MAG: NUDIX domain-containing protein [Actinomycetota bacterium]|nr:NUDIX domain-containing protein [Actinomycetota bacterium]